MKTIRKINVKKAQIITFIIFFIGVVSCCFSRFHWNIPIMAFIFPGCFLYFSRKNNKAFGLILVFLGLTFGSAIAIYNMVIGSGVSIGLGLAADILLGFTLFIPYILDRLVYIRFFKSAIVQMFLFAITWVCVDVIFEFTPVANYVSLGYSQYSILPLAQVVSLFGLHFLSFIIVLFSAGIALYFVNFNPKKKRENIKTIIISSSFLVFSLLYGGIYSIVPPISNNSIIVMNGYSTNTSHSWSRRVFTLEENINWFINDATLAKASNVNLLTYPEESFVIDKSEENAFIDALAKACSANNIYTVIGVRVNQSENTFLNQSWIIDNHGKLRSKYTKTHYVPFAEKGIIVGDGNIEVVDTPFGKLATVVCMDLEYPTYISKVRRLGADILVAPSWDWSSMPKNHSRSDSFRAIENGVNFIRVTEEGYSVSTDYRGNVICEYFTSANYSYKVAKHIYKLPTKGIATLYGYIAMALPFLYPISLGAIIVTNAVINKKKINTTK